MRFLLYSHDSWGLGHLRRSLTLADALTRLHPTAAVLIATGSPCATHFRLPERCDVVKLPTVTKDDAGRYVARDLPLAIDDLVGLRRRILLETYRAWSPDVVVIDHRVTGLLDEALPVLEQAGRDGVQRVLGLRDVVDAPEAVAREWGNERAAWALAEGYDEILVYGDRGVFDPRLEYGLPEAVARRVRFTGYLAREVDHLRRRSLPHRRPEVLVTLGGGGDGASRAHAILDGVETAPTPWDTSIVLGPLMDAEVATTLERRARALRGVDIRRFEPDLMARIADADLVVSMAGYNTTAELLASGRPTLLLPRHTPRREQEIRARRLADRGAVTTLVDPSALELRAAIAGSLDRRPRPDFLPDLDGARRAAEHIGHLAGASSRVVAERN